MMNRVVPLKGIANSLRGTPQREAASLRAHIFYNGMGRGSFRDVANSYC